MTLRMIMLIPAKGWLGKKEAFLCSREKTDDKSVNNEKNPHPPGPGCERDIGDGDLHPSLNESDVSHFNATFICMHVRILSF